MILFLIINKDIFSFRSYCIDERERANLQDIKAFCDESRWFLDDIPTVWYMRNLNYVRAPFGNIDSDLFDPDFFVNFYSILLEEVEKWNPRIDV
jgi:hypothetical protein